MKLSVSYDFLPKTRSVRSSQVMDHFGIGFETGRHVIAEDLELPIEPGDVVLFTGASGSGKSSLMRAAVSHLDGVINVDDLELPGRVLVDAIDLPVEESLPLLSSCGLGEAHLLLRTPAELSDGQRYRFRLALAVSQKPQWIVADEFTATLDRTLAKVVAFNIRRLADRVGIGFLLATTHEDVVADLAPSLHVQCRLDGRIDCGLRIADCGLETNSEPHPAAKAGETACNQKNHILKNPQSPIPNPKSKNDSSLSPGNSISPQVPKRTGRISLGGITAAITSGS